MPRQLFFALINLSLFYEASLPSLPAHRTFWLMAGHCARLCSASHDQASSHSAQNDDRAGCFQSSSVFLKDDHHGQPEHQTYRYADQDRGSGENHDHARSHHFGQQGGDYCAHHESQLRPCYFLHQSRRHYNTDYHTRQARSSAPGRAR
ncbi:hypothetical protein GCM10011383_26240 [Hymenobacter cavernae]|uniref:Secreted protein n=1 Tax=Hymenobacter cavernae TaxID=2044852 RepID=A0ABQ1U9Y3_9BACT|nr:hypothetical protein GCM10011383_26240 [Hymenobacter cavernae]